MQLQGKVWFIRHACSLLNLWDRCACGQLKRSNMSPEELKLLTPVISFFTPLFIDSPLCQLGKTQAITARDIVCKLPIKFVIVSPLRRTLETAKLMFETHPNKEKIEVVVNPVIRECLMYPDSIPSWTLRDRRKEYENCSDLKFDFGMMEGMEDSTYFLETMDPETQTTLKKYIDSSPKDEYDKALLNLMAETYEGRHGGNIFLESHANGRRRAKIFLQWLKNFMAEKQVVKGEIAVVTHMLFLKCLAAKSFKSGGAPVYPSIENAKPFEIDIDEVLSYYCCNRLLHILSLIHILTLPTNREV
eukprot:TRINITY_DN1847_c0_g2_i1.p1 TRINITY_DN1847_c0_g2~~TRINITY_DN1847_c0_g2_i1.p1  ORF type:complete len:303 (+),score=45.29 TRINITY_DN1847_c0_g2_i1:60-968(+)